MRSASLALLLLLLAGCPAPPATGPGPAGPDRPAEVLFEPRAPLAARYGAAGPAPSMKPFEAELLTMLNEVQGQLGRQPLAVDQATQAMARDICLGLRAQGPPPLKLVSFTLQSRGLISPPPHFVVSQVISGMETQVRLKLRNSIIRRVLAEGRFNRVGISVQFPMLTPGRRRVVIALLDSRARLTRPLPRQLKLGRKVTLSLNVDPAFSESKLVVTEPRGAIRSRPLSSAPLSLHCKERGAYQVEVTAVGRFGVEVLANFPVYCGQSPPAAVRYPLAVVALNSVAVMERDLQHSTNEIRRKAGLPALKRHLATAAVARGHSQDMLAGAFVGHVSPTNGRPTDRLSRAGVVHLLVRENAARAYSTEGIISGLMSSPAHRANIMAKDVTHLGTGVAVDRSAKPAVLYVTQNFIRPGTGYQAATAHRTVLQLVQRRRKQAGLPLLREASNLELLARQYIRRLVKPGTTHSQAEAELSRGLDRLGQQYKRVDSLEVRVQVLEALSQAKRFLERRYTHVGVGVGQQGTEIVVVMLLGQGR